MLEPQPLLGVPRVLDADPALVAASAGSGRPVAVSEPTRALFAAALVRTTARRPILLAVPTAIDADRVTHDLRAFLGAEQVELFPAWETLPFERVSPALE